MQRLLLVTLIGFVAQLIDGSTGMAYGVTSSSLMLLAGFAPATASASLHLAEVATTVASGQAHLRQGNVNGKMGRSLAIPGAIGAFLGATFLTSLPIGIVRPLISGLLLLVGCVVLARFTWRGLGSTKPSPVSRGFLTALGLAGGLCDAIGGGGWGPIVTTAMLAKSEAEARTIVGSVNWSEAAVAAAATLGFLLTSGLSVFSLTWVLGLALGGILAAPVAAWIVRRTPEQILGPLVGGMIIVTNGHTLTRAVGVSPLIAVLLLVGLGGLWLVSLRRARAAVRRQVSIQRAPAHQDIFPVPGHAVERRAANNG